MAGYSGTPLAKKLGLKEGYLISLINQPDYYYQLFDSFPDVEEVADKTSKVDFIHLPGILKNFILNFRL